MTTKLEALTDEFYTLEQFMLLPDGSFEPDREWYTSFRGEEWVFRYHLANRQWAIHQDNFVIGTEVRVLVSGHGTTMPSLTSMQDVRDCPKRIVESVDDIWIYLVDPKRAHSKSLVERKLWWRSIYMGDTKGND